MVGRSTVARIPLRMSRSTAHGALVSCPPPDRTVRGSWGRSSVHLRKPSAPAFGAIRPRLVARVLQVFFACAVAALVRARDTVRHLAATATPQGVPHPGLMSSFAPALYRVYRAWFVACHRVPVRQRAPSGR